MTDREVLDTDIRGLTDLIDMLRPEAYLGNPDAVGAYRRYVLQRAQLVAQMRTAGSADD